MAALRLRTTPSLSFLGFGRGLCPRLHQQPPPLSLTPSRRLALPARQPIHASVPHRHFTTRPKSLGVDWYKLSPERQIQELLGPDRDTKWGWAIYRCAFAPEFDRHWETLKRLVNETTRESVAESDAPEIIDRLDWAFVEDPTLDGASLGELKTRFRAWALAQSLNGKLQPGSPQPPSGSRDTYFIQVDEAALRSLLTDPQNPADPATQLTFRTGHVNIVRGWEDELPVDEAKDEFGDTIDNEDWMKMRASMLSPYFYVELDDNESWYAHYTPPPDAVCTW